MNNIDTSKPIPLTIHLEGKQVSFTKQDVMEVDLLSFSQALSEIHSMFAKSYVTSIGKSRLSQQSKEEFRIVALELKAGSLILDCLLVISPAIPCLFPILPSAIFEITCKAFELGKTIRKWTAKKETFHINIEGDNNTVVINTTTGETVQTTPEIMQTAINSNNIHNRMIRRLDENKLGNITIKSNVFPECAIEASVKDKEIYNTKLLLSENIEHFRVKIYDFNIDKGQGMLRIFADGQRIIDGIGFDIIKGQDFDDYALALTKDEVSISAIVAYYSDATLAGKIAKLYISKLTLTE